MANREVMTECPACLQKLRPGWSRCARCRLLLSDASAATKGSAGIPRRWWVGGALGVFALLAIVVAVSGDSAPPASITGPEPAPALAVSDEASGVDVSRAETAAETLSSAAAGLKREGAAAYVKGDYATALTQLDAAVAASPLDPEARNNLGQLLVRQGRAAEALPHFGEAVRLDGQRWSYRFNRARAYGVLDRWPDAIAEYRVAANLFPDDHATLYNLGLALMQVKDYPAAARALEQAIAAAPEEPSLLITLGTAYVGAEQPDHARATFERFLAVAPNDAEAPRVKALLDALAAAAR